jgi:hypothetical protein
MTTTRRTMLLLAAALTVGCAATPPPTAAPSPQPARAEQALEAYERFWKVSEAAYASPGTRDWLPELESVASGSALEMLTTDVLNYASFPAHTEGAVSRAPVVARVTDSRVEIVDCIDLGDSRLIADQTGEVLDDLANRVPRYTYRAEVVAQDDRWLVDRAEPALDEPC